MNEFDKKAACWDKDPMHWDRSAAVADAIKKTIPLNGDMTVMEYGAGTGITSFLIKDLVREIILVDNSDEMVRVMNEKIRSSGCDNLTAINFNLEETDYHIGKFDLLFTQMVLHHITDKERILTRFYNLLNPGGYLAIADLYREDGSFHGEGFTGDKGFDPGELGIMLEKIGFTGISHEKCFTINKKLSDNFTKSFDIFLLTCKTCS